MNVQTIDVPRCFRDDFIVRSITVEIVLYLMLELLLILNDLGEY